MSGFTFKLTDHQNDPTAVAAEYLAKFGRRALERYFQDVRYASMVDSFHDCAEVAREIVKLEKEI